VEDEEEDVAEEGEEFDCLRCGGGG
jgi:hypothetical protein